MSLVSNSISIEQFVEELSSNLRASDDSGPSKTRNRYRHIFRNEILREYSRTCLEADLVQSSNDDAVGFEMAVLNAAFHCTNDKFFRSIGTMKLVSEKLQKLVRDLPTDRSLEKLLAFKKSLMALERRY